MGETRLSSGLVSTTTELPGKSLCWTSIRTSNHKVLFHCFFNGKDAADIEFHVPMFVLVRVQPFHSGALYFILKNIANEVMNAS
jgi:hypothetical protein